MCGEMKGERTKGDLGPLHDGTCPQLQLDALKGSRSIKAKGPPRQEMWEQADVGSPGRLVQDWELCRVDWSEKKSRTGKCVEAINLQQISAAGAFLCGTREWILYDHLWPGFGGEMSRHTGVLSTGTIGFG